LKILIILNRIPWPTYDGGSLANYNLIKGLFDSQVSLKILALNPISDKVDVNTLPEIFHKAGLEYISINTKIKPLQAFNNLFGKKAYNLERFKNKSFEQLILHTLRNNTFDLIHLEGIIAATYLPLIKQNSQLPCFFRQHNVEYQIWQNLALNTKNPIIKWYYMVLAKRIRETEFELLQMADKVLAISETDAVVFRQWLKPEKVFMAGQGFELAGYEHTPKAVIPFSFFHLGNMSWLPNVEVVQEILAVIWPKIHQVYPKSKLFLAGKNMHETFLKHNSESVNCVGEVENAVDFMADKQILLVPLKSGSGIRIKILEAMALGKIVITSSAGAAGLPVKAGKELCIANDTNAYLAAIESIYNNPEYAKAMQNKARDFVSNHFDNKQVSQKLIQFYQSAINHS
jgi:glycosyltransferase involved in cell wall biosynthesis